MEDVSGAKITGGNTKVTYDVKELLAEIRDELKTINLQISGKAEHADVIRLETKLDTIERDPIWTNRITLSNEIIELKRQVVSLKTKIYVFGTVASILAMTAGAVSRLVFP